MLPERNTLNLMMTVTSRESLSAFITLYRDRNVPVNTITLGHGTADEQMLSLIGAAETEKAFCFTVVTGEKWLDLKKYLTSRLLIEAPGTGIAFIIPMSAVGGRRELTYLTDGQDYEKGEESVLKGTERELIIAVSNQGYNEMVMDAAREAGATGGTVIHARGTDEDKAERFLGISLASEKDMVFIVAPSAKKTAIMQSIMKKAGMGTKARAIVMSLPVTDTAGLMSDPDEE